MSRIKKKTDLERFEDKFIPEPNSGCWIWIGCDSNRYGSFYYPNYPRKYARDMVSSHKSALFLYKGILVPDGLEVMHSCDNGFCCNPSHLSLGTHTDNMQDMVNKKRNVSTKQVLSSKDVLAACQMRKDGFTVKDIAEVFGISSSQMSRVTAGMQPKWKRNCDTIKERNE